MSIAAEPHFDGEHLGKVLLISGRDAIGTGLAYGRAAIERRHRREAGERIEAKDSPGMIHRLVNLVQAMQCAQIAPPAHPENHDQARQIEDFLI